MKIPTWLSLGLSCIVIFISLFLVLYHTPARDITVGSAHFRVAIADTEARREQGLSDTASLASDHGMLFIFPRPDIVSFWMKDMHYPLDMVWIDAQKRVVGITANIDPSTYPNLFSPEREVKYVLEINAGASAHYGVHIGDMLTF